MVRDDGELRLLGESSLMMTVTLLTGTEALTATLQLPQSQGQVLPVSDHYDHILFVPGIIIIHVNDV